MSSSRAMQRLCGLMRKAVQDYEMIAPGDKVMVGVSGGKDSVALTIGLVKTKKRCKTALVTELVQAWMKNGEAGTGTYTGAVSIDAIKKQLLQDKEFLLEIEKSMGGTSCREVEETEPEDSDNLDMDEDMMLAGMSIFENEI